MGCLLQYDNTKSNTLRQTAISVHLKEIATPKIKGILRRMKSALAREPDGVAIAAPQIGVPLRIFVVSGKVFSLDDNDNSSNATAEDIVFINPEITKLSRKREWMEEGCLSVRYKYGKVKRAVRATVQAYNENGRKFTRGASGLLAQIFQHETDHLDGVLFLDKAKDVRELTDEEIEYLKNPQHSAG